MKKISIIIAIFAIFGLCRNASALSVNHATYETGDTIYVNCTPDDESYIWVIFDASTGLQPAGWTISTPFENAQTDIAGRCSTTFGQLPITIITGTTGDYVLTESPDGDYSTLATVQENEGYVGSVSFHFTEAETPPAPHIIAGTFFGTDISTGNSKALDLMASAGDSTKTTTKNMLPIVAVVGGVILAFIGIRFIVSLLHDTSTNKNKTRV